MFVVIWVFSSRPGFLVLGFFPLRYYELTMLVKQHLMNLWNDRQCEILTHLLEAFEQTLNVSA